LLAIISAWAGEVNIALDAITNISRDIAMMFACFVKIANSYSPHSILSKI
jgi:hypothetical protein